MHLSDPALNWEVFGTVGMSKRAIRFGGILPIMFGAAALACADGGYETDWDPKNASGVIGPANDTRSNFILLMADRYGTKVADPAQLRTAIVPFQFPYKVMIERMSPTASRRKGGTHGTINRPNTG